MTTKTLRRRFFSMAGRLTRSGAQTHFASSPGLALGGAVQPRPGPIARPAAPVLTALSATDPTPPNSRPPAPRGVSCCVQSHYHAIPSVPRPLSKPGAATENPLPCHIGPHGAQAFSLVGSLIPTCLAFTPPIGGFGLMR